MMSLLGLYLFLAVAAFSAGLVPVCRRIARATELLDTPGPRKLQREPVPYLGGVAIFVAFALGVLGPLALLLSGLAPSLLPAKVGEILLTQASLARERLIPLVLLLLGGGLCLGIGLLDDKYGARLSPWAKLAVQFAAAGMAVAAGARTSILGVPALDAVLSLLWIVAITNAINFVDNMDGLAAGIVLLASLILWAVAREQSQFFMEMILLVLAGAVAGFLPYNFYPASIYLGDAGSLFLGYTLGVLTTLESYVTHASPTLLPVLLPLIVLTVPVFDMASVIVIRLREGRPIYVGDRSHLSHRLVDLGLSVPRAVLALYLLQVGLGLAALLLLEVGLLGSVWVLAQWALSLALISVLLFVGRGKGDS